MKFAPRLIIFFFRNILIGMVIVKTLDLLLFLINIRLIRINNDQLYRLFGINYKLIFSKQMIVLFPIYLYRTRQRTSVETLSNVHSSSTPIEILRRICEQCGIQDIEYFDPVLCDGVSKF